ncbi:nuclear transport factor 2 family protein [Sediminibacterium roseum]|uniref:Nuclear transport factor 2 family protein n=1 Tax=Sediminibacterium roseum TaxID=1978412 RepID=A0ABW9ZSK7_9BACT|nr:nuclear transport factor 2 family protein [Sediminibacterium roseum]NCI48717.1 nuclear transport factor 2 family protein [Sediminibacterium roseum]
MSDKNKETLLQANALIAAGDNEGFLSFCTEDTQWNFVGDQVLSGKEAVRQWMRENYIDPPEFKVEHLISEGDFVTAVGKITTKDKDGKPVQSSYCDVWHFREGEMAGLQAFVIEDK